MYLWSISDEQRRIYLKALLKFALRWLNFMKVNKFNLDRDIDGVSSICTSFVIVKMIVGRLSRISSKGILV